MSTDVADDLHAAEDLAMGLARWARPVATFATVHPFTGLADAPPEVGHALAQLRALLERAGSYCRPGCEAEGDPESPECDDDCCGCPCGHVDAREAPEVEPAGT